MLAVEDERLLGRLDVGRAGHLGRRDGPQLPDVGEALALRHRPGEGAQLRERSACVLRRRERDDLDEQVGTADLLVGAHARHRPHRPRPASRPRSCCRSPRSGRCVLRVRPRDPPGTSPAARQALRDPSDLTCASMRRPMFVTGHDMPRRLQRSYTEHGRARGWSTDQPAPHRPDEDDDARDAPSRERPQPPAGRGPTPRRRGGPARRRRDPLARPGRDSAGSTTRVG